jgi:hypothetical protein
MGNKDGKSVLEINYPFVPVKMRKMQTIDNIEPIQPQEFPAGQKRQNILDCRMSEGPFILLLILYQRLYIMIRTFYKQDGVGLYPEIGFLFVYDPDQFGTRGSNLQ